MLQGLERVTVCPGSVITDGAAGFSTRWTHPGQAALGQSHGSVSPLVKGRPWLWAASCEMNISQASWSSQ